MDGKQSDYKGKRSKGKPLQCKLLNSQVVFL